MFAPNPLRAAPLALLLAALLLFPTCARAADAPPQTPGQTVFPTPERAAEALATATKKADAAAMLALFGPDGRDLFSSGDAVADRRALQVFAVAMSQGFKLEGTDPDHRKLVIGDEHWPFPVPLVRQSDGWRFDTDAGKREVRARRIGRNELAAIGLCQLYVIAQKQYAAQPHDGKPAGLYAQKIRSTPGQHDGLFWPTPPGEKSSPLGDLAAKAASEGYKGADASQGPQPLRGYCFRILTQQGPAAPGGAISYLVNDRMPVGFALIAYPAEYGNSGIMTFIVNRDGIVQEADLGPDTTKIAPTITAYDPDPRFHPVE